MPVYLTDARPFGEIIDIRELVQPNTYMVQRAIRSVKAKGSAAIAEAWASSVCRISYPPAKPVDWHRVEAYLHQDHGLFVGERLHPVFTIEKTEILESPAEVMALGMADCDGQSILACSVLRNFLAPEEVYVTFGTWNGFGHAWVTLMGDTKTVLETTKQHEACRLAFQGLREGSGYLPMFRFNDRYAEDLAHISEIIDDQTRFLPLERIGLHLNHMEKVSCLQCS